MNENVYCTAYKVLHEDHQIYPWQTPVVEDANLWDEKRRTAKTSSDGIPSVSMIQLFRFANRFDRILLYTGLVAAILSSTTFPCQTMLMGWVLKSMQAHQIQRECHSGSANNSSESYLNNTTFEQTEGSYFHSHSHLQQDINFFCISMATLGLIQFLLSNVMINTLNASAKRQIFTIRTKFLESILRQDISWYDATKTEEFASRTSEDLTKLQDGMGEKVGICCHYGFLLIFNIINSLAHGWKLTLVILSMSPVIFVVMIIIGRKQANMARKELKAYATAGSLAEEVLTGIRTVVAFGGEQREVERYESRLVGATKAAIRRGVLSGLGGGTINLFINLGTALAFWYGIKLIVEERGQPNPEYDISTLINVITGINVAVLNLGHMIPYLDVFSQARGAAATVFHIIDRVPAMDSSSQKGLQPPEVQGDITLENVNFRYPTRPEVQVLNDIILTISKGETVALVGESGCGKSTVTQLIQRFYDPNSGAVKLDGHDIQLLKIGWLRNQIGVVGQEPILFGTTIAENIRYGNQSATQEEIERAATNANAHNFIMKLPKKYETLVGERGVQLSGGQKQRVAIARALIKDPKILLLDEATSALDSESEAIVQKALDKACKGRTTIIIAHRLSTIRNASKIAALSKGRIVEIGNHADLMALKGVYYNLVTTQKENAKKEAEAIKEEECEIQEATTPENENSLTVRITDGHLKPDSDLRRLSSITTEQLDTLKELESTDETLKPSIIKILRVNRPEWPYILLGLLGAFATGCNTTIFCSIYGYILEGLSKCGDHEVMQVAEKAALIFVGVGVYSAVAAMIQHFMLTAAGSYLTSRLRKLSFAAVLKQEIAWFDEPINSVGSLCSKLSADAASVQGATGLGLGTILQALTTMTISLVVPLILLWKLALVCIAFAPFILMCVYFQKRLLAGQNLRDMESLDAVNKIAVEAIGNIRTVASLHIQETFLKTYTEKLREPPTIRPRMKYVRGIVYACGSSISYFNLAACIGYSGHLLLHENVSYATVFLITQILMFGTNVAGNAIAFTPNLNKGLLAAGRIFQLLERKSKIDSSVESGLRVPDNIDATIEFKDVEFRYPTRPTAPVLRKMNLKITSGQVVALVGGSGCGKSTCIQLLERFYDARSGSVEVGGMDVAQLNPRCLRSLIGIVSQEPALFDRSIAENIAYGDNGRAAVPMDEIILAAKRANIHKFISSLPQGYQTMVGSNGTQLSGGQKQRIAIARSLIRNPKILLLDEATSALDSESEKVVQEALEEAQKGRTCITVAHRLSTIKNADLIAVIHRGKVVETGKHEELLATQGHYFQFYKMQTEGSGLTQVESTS